MDYSEAGSKIDRMVLSNAAGLLSVVTCHLQRALKRIPKRDRSTRDLIETAMMMSEDAQALVVFITVPTKEQQTVKADVPPRMLASRKTA